MSLSTKEVEAAATKSKPYKLFDAGGLHLYVTPKGSKLWRLKYRFDGKEKVLSFGSFPEVSLKEARAKRDTARKLLTDGVDPSAHKKAARAAREAITANAFEVVAREWYETKRTSWSDSNSKKIIERLERDIFPWLGKRPVQEITAKEVLDCLRRIEKRGAVDTAHRALQNCSQVFRYAVQTARLQSDPTRDLKGALPPAKPGNFAAITDAKEVGALLRAIHATSATFVVQCALKLAPYLFCRPGELRQMRWREISFEKAEWSYTVSKTKTAHIVPLATQAIAILLELQPLTGRGEYVFPGARDKKKPMSDGAINNALRRAGYNTREQHTGHGFRAMARTILHEDLGIAPAVIEHQLAHRVPDALGTAYNRTKFLKDRREMMQKWADHLDMLRENTEEN